MVNLEPYFRPYEFNHGLELLEKGYRAASGALKDEIAQAEAASKAYETATANGGKIIGEWDDDGTLLWEQSQMYAIQIDDIHLALFEVRKAFVIALYHFWEDSVARWMKKKGQITHEKMVDFCASQGYGPSPDIGAARCLANHLKHGRNSGKDWLASLEKDHPEFLPQPRGYLIGITEDTLYKVAAAIYGSGPSYQRSSEAPPAVSP